MCCRYYMFLTSQTRVLEEELRQSPLTQETQKRIERPVKTSGEIRPTDLTTVYAANKNGVPKAFAMVWGYRGKDGRTTLFNARSETAAEKPTFREDWLTHRCAVPASGYYEWTKRKNGASGSGTKYAVHSRNGEAMWLCGPYRMEEGVPHFVILTRDASEPLAFLHDRMPLVLAKTEVRRWIDPHSDPAQLLKKAEDDLCAEEAKQMDETTTG